jgi:hypothetical protein
VGYVSSVRSVINDESDMNFVRINKSQLIFDHKKEEIILGLILCTACTAPCIRTHFDFRDGSGNEILSLFSLFMLVSLYSLFVVMCLFATGLRGVTSNVCIMEEAAFMTEALFQEIIVPLMTMGRTAVLAISTPDTEDNHYSEMTEMKKPGSADEGLFRVIKVGLFCESCMQRKALRCPHKRRLPSFKSERGQEIAELLMEANPERMRRELHGMIGSKKQFLYKPYIEKMRLLKAYKWRNKPAVLHLAIDPSGGSNSEWSYCLVGHEDPYDVIVSCYGIQTQDRNDIFSLFIALFTLLRKPTSIYRDSLVIVYVEGNSGWFNCTDLQTLFRNRPRIFGYTEFQLFKDNKDVAPGVWTTDEFKEKYAYYLRIKMSGGQLRWAHELVGAEDRMKEERKKMYDQLAFYRKEIKESIAPGFIPDKAVYTGKSGGRRDDLCMALQIGLYQMQMKRDDPAFQARVAKEGWIGVL